ncbi:MAG: sterol desaturase family protein [Aeromicrobium sp.]|uniref:sterol desaturase family protein n=1 Tax=Aeromicrobium sp. TaxID=1871063 RepID=UPI0039E45851
MDELLDPMKNPFTFAVPFFLLFILIELAALKWLDHDAPPLASRAGGAPNPTGYALKDARASISMGLVSVFFLTAFKVVTFLAFVVVFANFAIFDLPVDAWWYWVLLMLGIDFSYYWHHRFSHRVRIAWAGHQAHHSSEYMNFGTALRQKWNPWFEFFFWLPFPLLGFEPWTIYVAFSLNLVYQFFVHTELVDKLPRPIEFVFNTPSHHRVHHGSDPEYLDTNYAGIFIIWDRLFGTFTEERQRPTYGLTKKVDTYNLLKLQYGHYGDIARDVKGARSLRDKMGYIFGPPGWKPADPAAAEKDLVG